MKHPNRGYLIPGIFFALYTYSCLSDSIPLLLVPFWGHMADPWGWILDRLLTMATADLPYLLLTLYCFFLHRKKAAPWVFAAAFLLLATHSILETIRAESYPVNHYAAVSNGLSGLFAIMLVFAKFFRRKGLFILSGGLLIGWHIFDIWWNFVADAPNYYDPMTIAFACLAGLFFVARLVAYGLLWRAERLSNSKLSFTPEEK